MCTTMTQLKTRPKVYRCDRGIAAIVAQDLHSSKCQAKLKYEWTSGYIYLNVWIFEYSDI